MYTNLLHTAEPKFSHPAIAGLERHPLATVAVVLHLPSASIWPRRALWITQLISRLSKQISFIHEALRIPSCTNHVTGHAQMSVGPKPQVHLASTASAPSSLKVAVVGGGRPDGPWAYIYCRYITVVT